MGKFRKVPVEVEAVEVDAIEFSEVKRNILEVDQEIMEGNLDARVDLPRWIMDALNWVVLLVFPGYAVIRTTEGNALVLDGDWIIKGENGELHPCKPDVFAKMYEATE